jgi:Holliday junction resolvase RusA-like endonuclease
MWRRTQRNVATLAARSVANGGAGDGAGDGAASRRPARAQAFGRLVGLGSSPFVLVMTRLEWSVPGKPAPQKRHRYASRTNHMYDPSAEQKRNFLAESIKACPLPDEPLEGALRMELTFTYKHLKKRKRDHTARPDLDNLSKLVMDALQGAGGYFMDDSQVVELVAKKEYGDEPSTKVYIACI